MHGTTTLARRATYLWFPDLCDLARVFFRLGPLASTAGAAAGARAAPAVAASGSTLPPTSGCDASAGGAPALGVSAVRSSAPAGSIPPPSPSASASPRLRAVQDKSGRAGAA